MDYPRTRHRLDGSSDAFSAALAGNDVVMKPGGGFVKQGEIIANKSGETLDCQRQMLFEPRSGIFIHSPARNCPARVRSR